MFATNQQQIEIMEFGPNHLTLRCGFVVQLVSTVDKILSDIARRAVRLR